MISPELEAKFAIWRAQAVEGTLSIDDMRAGIILLREGRLLAVQTSDRAKVKKAKQEIPDADTLLNDL